MDEDRVKLMIQKELHSVSFVNHEFCAEKHKEVTAVSEMVKRVDNRLWAVVLVGLAQLGALIGLLLKGKIG